MNLRRDMTEQRGEGEGSHPINPINSARQMSFRIPISIHKVDRSLSSLLPDPKSLIRHISGEGTAAFANFVTFLSMKMNSGNRSSLVIVRLNGSRDSFLFVHRVGSGGT